MLITKDADDKCKHDTDVITTLTFLSISFRASQVTIYRPCRVIMSAEKRSMGRPGHDPSALSTFQSLKVLRIRILKG